MKDWEPPRCRHGKIILGCSDDQCPEQNAYLAEHEAALVRWREQQEENARLILFGEEGKKAAEDFGSGFHR